MKLLFAIVALAFSDCTFAQGKHLIYKTSRGIFFTHEQLDSLVLKGGGGSYAIKDSRETNDSIIFNVEILDRLPTPEFVRRFKGSQIPKLKLLPLDAGTYLSTASLTKPMMINFWSVTCGPCVSELPQLNELKRKYGDKVTFLAIAPESDSIVRSFLAKHLFEFTIVANSKSTFELFGIDAYPENIFVAQNGTIEFVQEGTPLFREHPSDKFRIGVLKIYSRYLDSLLAPRRGKN